MLTLKSFRDQQLKKADKWAKITQEIETLAEADPEGASELAHAMIGQFGIMTEPETITKKPKRAKKAARQKSSPLFGPKTLIQTIEDWFAKRNNEWATSNEIVDGTELNRNSATHVIYSKHKDRFETRENPNGEPGKQFRVKKS